MSKLTLDIVDEYPFIVIGISSSAKDYRLSWSLNMSLGIHLHRENSLEIIPKSSDKIDHGFYLYEDENLQVTYRLVENKRSGSKFLPEVNHADFLLIIDESPVFDTKKLVQQIQGTKLVQLAFLVDISQLKHRQNLLLTT